MFPTTMTGEDLGLLERCQAGEELAWSEFVDRHYDFVWRAARRLGTPEAELDDVVQDSFTIAFKSLSRFQSGKVTTWLFRVVANQVSNRHRARRLREAFVSLFRPQLPVLAPSPERAWEAREAERLVAGVLAKMAPKKREVFALFELEGQSGEEIAELVGCSVATVWTRLHYARQEFERLVRKAAVLE